MLLFALVFAGCTKPEDGIGLDLLPDGVSLGAAELDTTTIVAWSVPSPPVRTSNLSRTLLGSYLDDKFGRVSASIVTQLRLSTNNVGVGVDPADLVCDSLVLSMVYDPSAYGYGNLDPQVIKAFELAEYFPNDTTYTSDRLPQVANLTDLVEAGRGLFTPQPFATPVIDGVTLKPQLRIPLDRALGERFLSKFGSVELQDNTNFLQYFKGLWLLPANAQLTPYQNAVLYFTLLDAQSKMTLYYRDTVEQDTLSFDFLINDNGVRFTHMEFAPDEAVDPGLPQALADTTQGERVYVQSVGGARGRLRLPFLAAYTKAELRNVAKAELVVPVEGSFYPAYLPPSQLFLFRRDANGNDALLPDQLSASGNIGGTYDSDKREYRFIITRWLQGVLNGDYPDADLIIVPGSNGVTMNRVILGGPGHPERPMKLLLTFTTT
ncbi:MAG: DUF4270 family protein [Flavobacteriales bacterium]|nr:DUF4270 family protein [Flavobacteriales bacterium]